MDVEYMRDYPFVQIDTVKATEATLLLLFYISQSQ